MKTWSKKEQKKIHDRRIKNAKPTISMRKIVFNSPVLEKLPPIIKQTPPAAARPKIGEGSSSKAPVYKTAIYKLLKAFKLQQYARVTFY